MTIISSCGDKVDGALSRLKSSFPENNSIEGYAVSVTDEDNFVALLQKLSPIDHLVYTAVDTPTYTPLNTIDVSKVKELFDVKFWGAVTTATGLPF